MICALLVAKPKVRGSISTQEKHKNLCDKQKYLYCVRMLNISAVIMHLKDINMNISLVNIVQALSSYDSDQ